MINTTVVFIVRSAVCPINTVGQDPGCDFVIVICAGDSLDLLHDLYFWVNMTLEELIQSKAYV